MTIFNLTLYCRHYLYNAKITPVNHVASTLTDACKYDKELSLLETRDVTQRSENARVIRIVKI
jgi:hypothetical protein